MMNIESTTISLCMIVKNEEKYIERCLKSVRNCVDEMVVVDTGSTDKTVEIAKSYDAKVYHHPWENDFSKHRNQSLSYANGDWIFWIDADEVLEPGGGDILRKAVKNDEIDSLMVTMVCYFENRNRESWNNAIKLFKKNTGIHFEGSVHNQVVGCLKTEFCPAKIYHYGYDSDPNNVQKKFRRTSNLLKQAIEEDPDNYIHYHNLAVSYSSVRHFQQSVKEGLTAIELYKKAGATDQTILWTYFVVASSFYNLNKVGEARAIAEEALKIYPDHIDSYFVLAAIYAKQNNRREFEGIYERVVHLINKYKENPESLAGLIVNKIGEKWRLDLEYGKLFLAEGSEKEAKKWVEQAADCSSSPASIYRLGVIASREYGLVSLAQFFLEKAKIEGMDSQTVAFEKALNMRAAGDDSGCCNIIEDLLQTEKINTPEIMASLGTEALKLGKYEKAEALFNAAKDLSYYHPKLFTSLALACKYQNNIDKAVAWNIRALEMDENELDALTNLGHIYFDLKKWNSAKTYYEKALSVSSDRKDVLFRLSLIALMEEDLDGCVGHCELLLKEFNKLNSRVVQNLKDVAFIYRQIGEGFQAIGRKQLHLEAMNFANMLEAGS